jgi:AcrR family transcriptional regulator
VKAAVLVFREKGYEATTLHDIAAKLNTDRASLYYYASGKEEPLRAAVRTSSTTPNSAAKSRR